MSQHLSEIFVCQDTLLRQVYQSYFSSMFKRVIMVTRITGALLFACKYPSGTRNVA
jgi:hypothetical protein